MRPVPQTIEGTVHSTNNSMGAASDVRPCRSGIGRRGRASVHGSEQARTRSAAVAAGQVLLGVEPEARAVVREARSVRFVLPSAAADPSIRARIAGTSTRLRNTLFLCDLLRSERMPCADGVLSGAYRRASDLAWPGSRPPVDLRHPVGSSGIRLGETPGLRSSEGTP